MKLSLVSLAVGLVFGALYGMLYVRSPAPPVVALVGLLGILMGEQIPPLVRHVFARTSASVTRIDQVKPHVFGSLPAGRTTPEKPS
jgi:XapX domain-containing protein